MAFFPPITSEEAAAKLKAFDQFKREPDGLVYHYTSLAGLAGIPKSECARERPIRLEQISA